MLTTRFVTIGRQRSSAAVVVVQQASLLSRKYFTLPTAGASANRFTTVLINASRSKNATTTTQTIRRHQSTEKVGSSTGAAAVDATTTGTSVPKPKGWWHSAEFWGGLGALAGWGMSGSAIYDAMNSGPEVISLSMTPVLIVYSSLFARWAWVVKPQNLLLCSCHIANICAQGNQLRRALEYKISIGQVDEVNDITQKSVMGGVVLAGSILGAPTMRSYLTNANLGIVSTIASADAGPFTVHFWAPMSKWMISGASFFDLHRPTDKISIAQYTALTLTGFFFTRYALLISPVNYMLCAVNGALFSSSAWHLGRKINADYITIETKQKK